MLLFGVPSSQAAGLAPGRSIRASDSAQRDFWKYGVMNAKPSSILPVNLRTVSRMKIRTRPGLSLLRPQGESLIKPSHLISASVISSSLKSIDPLSLIFRR
jgi:hypothetical protein